GTNALFGWSFQIASKTWNYNTPGGRGASDQPGVYYGHWVTLNVQGGGSSSSPWQATLISETKPAGGHSDIATYSCGHAQGGDVTVHGNPVMSPFPSIGTSLIAIVAGRDVDMSGTGGTGASIQGSISVHEQFQASGTIDIHG